MSLSWKCPFCNHNVFINSENRFIDSFEFNGSNKHGIQVLKYEAITCPNPACREFTLRASIHTKTFVSANVRISKANYQWQLIPSAEMKVFPSYIPEPILNDYKEACSIRDLSPKASATLSRRCLQGMIRDFWGISKARLVDEIAAIQTQVDPTTWAAIEAVRKIGNIGAHMEKDINVIVDVEPEEAALLIGLIEMLLNDWYVVRNEREQQLAKLIATAVTKDAAKKVTSTP